MWIVPIHVRLKVEISFDRSFVLLAATGIKYRERDTVCQCHRHDESSRAAHVAAPGGWKSTETKVKATSIREQPVRAFLIPKGARRRTGFRQSPASYR